MRRRWCFHGFAVIGEIAPMITLRHLFRYPVKGLSPEPLDGVDLVAGRPLPLDRAYALGRPGRGIDPASPQWAVKSRFLMLMLDEGLARVHSHLDEATRLLTLRAGGEELRADLRTAAGREAVETFIAGLPGLRSPGRPRLVAAEDGHFMDKPDPVVSLINLASIRALEAWWGEAIDPLRFRANIYIDGAPPWAEFGWVGGSLAIGSLAIGSLANGGARLRVDRRNGRCAAVNVDPASGLRDRDIPARLRQSLGHKDFGIYLLVERSGRINRGDTVTVFPPASAKPPTAGLAPAPGRYACRACYAVFDPARGDPAQGVPPDTPPDAMPPAWRCPDCGVAWSAYAPCADRGFPPRATTEGDP
jgi:GntR family transcriptional regulator / MocR family aminotransferase